MIPDLPFYVTFPFILTTLFTAGFFFVAARNSKTVLFVLLGWLILQTVLALNGFYTVTDTLPPRFALLAGPPVLVILFLFITEKARRFLDSLDLRTLTWLHTIRMPVEVTLLLLSIHRLVPELMTFEGRNFDIVSGVTAPLVAVFAFRKHWPSRILLLVWNFICLGLLLNIVVHAILAAPSSFQQLAFDQPNRAILYFPFVWLPCCVVPIVLLAHLAAIRQLLRKDWERRP